MVLNWEKFLEAVKVKGLNQAISNQETFSEIEIDLTGKNTSLKDVVKKVSKHLKLFGELEAYKSGAYGVTFITNKKTLKITTASDEALMVKKIIKEQKKKQLSNIIKYEDIFELKIKTGVKKGKRKYYAILMERITPLDSPDCPPGVLDFYKKYLDYSFSGIESLDELDIEVDKSYRRLQRDKKTEFKKYVDDMAQIIRDYMSIGLENQDFHFGNFGINSKGKLVSFDPMGYQSREYKIKKIKI